MTFGQIKTIIENQLIESYKDGKEFKQSLKEFKEDVLDNKNISKLYSLYTDLSTPQGLSEQDAYEFIKEGIDLIQKTLPKVNLPKGNIKESKNNYKSIDELVYVDQTCHLFLNQNDTAHLGRQKQIYCLWFFVRK